MTILNFGSINADLFYDLPHLPAPGETLAATGHTRGLGGKGANQSVAAARAGSRVIHLGAVGPDGSWAVDRLAGFGVETGEIAHGDAPTGHAIVMVDAAGENSIVICPGANRGHDPDRIAAAIARAEPGDTLMLQNETDCLVQAASAARDAGLRVIFSAAPFSLESVRAVMPFADIVIMNQLESDQLTRGLGLALADLPVGGVLVTLGARGAEYHDLTAGRAIRVASPPVRPVDTTGAGDTFAGYFAAGLDQGREISEAMRLAAAAAACKVTRKGTADAIPTRRQVETFARDIGWALDETGG